MSALFNLWHKFTQWRMTISLAYSSASLAREQYRVLSGHMTTLYLCLIANAYFMAIAVSSSTGFLLAYSVPALLTFIMLVRIHYWKNTNDDASTLPIEDIRKKLKSSPIMTTISSVVLGVWAISILNTASPDDKSYVALFAVLQCIACAYCIMSVPVSALIVIGIGAVPISIALIISGNPNLMLMGANLIVIGVLVLKMVFGQFRQLRNIVESRTQIQIEKSRINRMAYRDHLTDLPNRRSFMHDLEILNEDQIGSGIAIIMMDLDGFKPINDTYGHDVGDKLLLEIGRRFSDVTNGKAIVSRLGGDEFALLLRNISNVDQAKKIAKKLVQSLSAAIIVSNHKLRVGTSLGIAYSSDPGVNGVSLLKQADIALYEAKNDPVSSISIFQTKMEDRVRRRTMIEQALADPSQAKGIKLFYQPIYNIHTKRVIAFEALARWDHPELGTIGPAEFIPIAEQAGRIELLTASLFRRALETAKTWPDTVHLSFNLSAIQIASHGLKSMLIGEMMNQKFDPERLTFEITETALLSDFAAARVMIEEFKAYGIDIALDDFGAGYASIGYLREIRFDNIKLDGSLIANVTEDERARELLAGVVYLAKAVGALITAEMVESEAQLDLLRVMPINHIQGYLMSQPVAADQTLETIAMAAASEILAETVYAT